MASQSNNEKKSKKRNLIIIILIVLLLLLGVGYYFWHQSQNKTDNSTTSQSQTSQAGTQPSSSSSRFNPASMQGQSFVATLSGTQDGKPFTATISYDGKTSYSYDAAIAGQTVKMYVTKDAFYTCTGSTCYKTAVDANSTKSFDPSTYAYSAEDISNFKNSAAYKGQQSCISGTCDVWEVSATKTGSTKLFLDSSSHRITQVEYTENGNTFKVTYDYKPVTITIPANAKTLQTP